MHYFIQGLHFVSGHSCFEEGGAYIVFPQWPGLIFFLAERGMTGTPEEYDTVPLSCIRGVVANYLASQAIDPGIDSHQHRKDSWHIRRHMRNVTVLNSNLSCLLIFLHGRSRTCRVASLRAGPVGRISYNLYFDCKHARYVTCDFNKRIYLQGHEHGCLTRFPCASFLVEHFLQRTAHMTTIKKKAKMEMQVNTAIPATPSVEWRKLLDEITKARG